MFNYKHSSIGVLMDAGIPKNVNPDSEEILLAHPRRRDSFLGRIMHDFGKFLIRAAVDRIHSKMEPVLDYKRKNGWINPEVEELEKDINWLIDLDRNNPRPNKNLITFQEKLRDIVLVNLDEDSYYNLRFWFLMMRIQDNRWKDTYDIAMNRANAYFNYKTAYRQLYEELQGVNDSLPIDVEDEKNGDEKW